MNPKNPYYVLEVGPDATPGEIERQGRKVVGLLEVGSDKAKKYRCPLGEFERDATMVREAIAVLRDPKERERAACLVRLFQIAETVGAGASGLNPTEEHDAPVPNAFLIGGFKGL